MNPRKKSDTLNVQYEVADPAVMAIMPVVSVKMITYNHGHYLAEAIEGVIAQQTDFPIELVIAEDCSTDNTREIALDYQRLYPKLIRVIYSDHNVGMMVNSKRAMAACRGEFIAYCEGDDYWIDPNKLREQVAVLKRFNNIDITFHSCYLKYEKQQKEILSNVQSPTDKVFTLSEVIAGDGGFMPSASLLVRRSLLVSIQDWFDATMPPVGDYFIQVFGSQRGGAFYMNKPMSVYRTEVNESWSETTSRLHGAVEFEKRFFSAVKELEYLIPGQEIVFHHLIVTHCSLIFITATNESFIQIKELLLPVLKELYESKTIVRHSSCSDRMELEYLLKLAVDRGKTRETDDQTCGLYRQLARVAKSLFDYGAIIPSVIYTNWFGSNDYERTIAKWKMEAQRSYLIARYKRLCRLAIGK